MEIVVTMLVSRLYFYFLIKNVNYSTPVLTGHTMPTRVKRVNGEGLGKPL